MYEGGYTSAARGWSTGVAELTNELFGASPATPGFDTWTRTPGSVRWARGQLPTPHGRCTSHGSTNPVNSS